jgi:P27 family predicted phage terminase small subunit
MSKGRRKNPPKGRTAGAPPTCPDWLDDAARGVWAVVVPQLRGHVEEIDEYALACFCVTFARWRAAEQDVTERGLRIGEKLNPSVKQSDAFLKQLRGMLAELGLTPASRGRLGTGDTSDRHPDEDALDAITSS